MINNVLSPILQQYIIQLTKSSNLLWSHENEQKTFF